MNKKASIKIEPRILYPSRKRDLIANKINPIASLSLPEWVVVAINENEKNNKNDVERERNGLIWNFDFVEMPDAIFSNHLTPEIDSNLASKCAVSALPYGEPCIRLSIHDGDRHYYIPVDHLSMRKRDMLKINFFSKIGFKTIINVIDHLSDEVTGYIKAKQD